MHDLTPMQEAIREWELALLRSQEASGDRREAESPKLVATIHIPLICVARVQGDDTQVRVSLFSGDDLEDEDQVNRDVVNPKRTHTLGYIDVIREASTGSLIGFYVENRGYFTVLGEAVESLVEEYVLQNQNRRSRVRR